MKFKSLLLYGALMAVLIFGLKWLEWRFLIVDHSLNIYIGLIALFFNGLGVWVAKQLLKPKIEQVVVEKEIIVKQAVPFEINQSALQELKLSNREYESLQLLAKGYSNAAIASELFLSLSTIKTHVSNLFVKMSVKSRTQAIEKARRLQIIE